MSVWSISGSDIEIWIGVIMCISSFFLTLQKGEEKDKVPSEPAEVLPATQLPAANEMLSRTDMNDRCTALASL